MDSIDIRTSDPGLTMVHGFHLAFGAHISPHPQLPEPELYEAIKEDLEAYHKAAARLGEALKDSSKDAGPGGSLLLIRLQLIQEELAELAEAFIKRDIVACLDALNDLSYVVDGTYLTLGLQEAKLEGMVEVHRANMSKLGEDGKPIISDAGRVVKGPNYAPPDLAPIVEALLPEAFPDFPEGEAWLSSAGCGIPANVLLRMYNQGILDAQEDTTNVLLHDRLALQEGCVMPCTYTGSLEGDRILGLTEALDVRERMLCALITRLEKEHGEEHVGMLLHRAATDAEGLERKDIKRWWKRHKAADILRKRKEGL